MISGRKMNLSHYEHHVKCATKKVALYYQGKMHNWKEIIFIFNKTNRCTNFPNLFCQETPHVSGSSSAHHQEFSTVHSALVYVMQVC